jgi:hypothetical protein
MCKGVAFKVLVVEVLAYDIYIYIYLCDYMVICSCKIDGDAS